MAKTKKKKKTSTKKNLTARDRLTKKALARMQKEADEQALELYLGTLSKYADKKVQTFLNAISKSGFEDDILKMPVSEVARAVIGSAAPKKGKKRKKGERKAGTRTRLTKQGKQKLMDSIVAQVKKAKEPIGKADIASAIGADAKRLTLPLRELVSDGTLASKGAKRGTKYIMKAKK